MTRHDPSSQLIVLTLLACLLISGSSCQAPQRTSDPPPQPARSVASSNEAQTSVISQRDLSQDEAAGGHTLRKHVGRTDEELRERLRLERHIAAASTWTDRATAEQSVGTALAQNTEKIAKWLNRPSGHPNLVVDYDGDHPIGRTLQRGSDQSRPCDHAVIVLKWRDDGGYYVLTSYPECR